MKSVTGSTPVAMRRSYAETPLFMRAPSINIGIDGCIFSDEFLTREVTANAGN
jgi:hypothetical protein